ncbi:MAG: outer membrane protein assembly factor BamA [Candidatus Ornithospirochaeta sp.]|nr:outer membrane protein assembly factor BamA [Sphaerochaetaceae bacterium]MDY5524080.1 outer membrane protein assembly factor BamA [Candidatus Ornithospirochaeta sp.]
MDIFKKIVVLTLILLSLSAIYAEDGNWYEGETITDITFTGLVNVKDKTAKSVVSEYVGQPFTDELFTELDASLYGQSWLEWMIVDAVKDETTGGLVLNITVSENPMISEVKIIGNNKVGTSSLMEAQGLSKGSFYSSNNISANASLLKDYYLTRGYRDVKVEATVNEKDDNTVIVVYTIEEGRQYKVRSVLFEGIEGVTREELKKLLTTKEKSFFDSGNFQEANIDKDVAAIVEYYTTKGYPDAKVVSSDVVPLDEESTESTRYINIVYVIEEGSLWTIGDISFSGNEIFSDEEIQSLITVNPGDRYDSKSLTSVFEAIASLYYDNGYVYSNIIPQITRENDNKVSINLIIVEGTQAKVEEIRINGLTKTKPYVLEREMAVKVGDVFSRSAFIQSQQNMYNTSLLKNISAALYPGKTEDGVICEFNVEEGNQMELQFGATFGATEINGFPVSGFLSLTNNNLGGTGRALSISTELSPSKQSMSVSLSDKWTGNKRWANGISLSFERSVRTGVLQKGIGSDFYDGRDSLKETYPLGYSNAFEWYYTNSMKYPGNAYLMNYDYYSFNLGYNTGYTWVFAPGSLSVSGGASVGLNHAEYDNTKYTPYEKLISQYNDGWQLSNKIYGSLTWDGRNYVSAIPYGYVLSASLTYAGGALGGLSNYNKISLSGSVYRSVFQFGGNDGEKKKNIILGLSSEVDFMLPQYWLYGDRTGWQDPKMGATKYEMLYIDGMNIGRGFSVVYDQAFLWNNQIDLTYPLAEDVLSVEAFASATGVHSDLASLNGLSSINWYMAGGVGLKMEIPGFPLGLYLVKNATIKDGEGWKWQNGALFSNKSEGSGLSLVLAITTSIY